MNTRLTVTVALLAACSVGLTPAHAGTKKPKPIKGSYQVALNPDPTADAFSSSGTSDPVDGNCGAIGASQDAHAFKIPAAGTLKVVLDAPNPLPASTPLGPDWDLHILDSDGSELSASTSETSHEETTDKFKKKQAVTFLVCNITGSPTATVSYTFTYK